MKKYFLLLLLVCTFAITSCEKDGCTQPALCTLVSSQDYGKVTTAKGADKLYVCHNGQTKHISVNALQAHLNHGDTEGQCQTLSDGGLKFRDGEVVEIDCGYSLPFVHVTENGTQWLYSKN